MSSPPPKPKTIAHLFDAVYPSFAMLAGMELELFTPLRSGPMSVETLADAIGVQSEKLKPLLYALVAAGLLTVEGNHFANTPEADHYLVRGMPGYLGGLQQLTSSNWSRVLTMAEVVRSGRPPEGIDYHASSREEIVRLYRGLYPGSVADASRLIKHDNFSSYDTFLDVGGGSGALAITIAQANARIKATVLELPSVVSVTRDFIEEANLSQRVTTLAGNAVHDIIPGTYDVVIARHVIQVLSEKESRLLLNNLASVINPGGKIYLIGWVLNDSRTSPLNIVGYNLILLSAYQDGQAYTEQEYFAWLTEAGFVNLERILMPNGTSIVSAHKPR